MGLLSILACAALFAIPADAVLRTIDLSPDVWRRVIVDREPGQYLGHVTTALLDDGRSMIAVYPKGNGQGALRVGGRPCDVESPARRELGRHGGDSRGVPVGGLQPAWPRGRTQPYIASLPHPNR